MQRSLCLGGRTAQIAWRRVGERVAAENAPAEDDPAGRSLLVRLLFDGGEGVRRTSSPKPVEATRAPERVSPQDVSDLVNRRTTETYGALQVLVSEQSGRRAFSNLSCELLHGELPPGSFVSLPSGILLPCPELELVLMGRVLDEVSLAAYACELCGFYALSETSPLGFVSCPALASVTSIRRYAARLAEVRRADGSRSPHGVGTLLQALGHVVDGAASPAETSCALLLSLPRRLGGYALPKPELNQPIRLEGEVARLAGCDTLVCDLSWPGTHTVLEYASELHKLPGRAAKDRRKANVLQSAGYDVIEVGREELMDRVAMDGVATMVARSMGTCLSPTDRDFGDRQLALRKKLLPGPA